MMAPERTIVHPPGAPPPCRAPRGLTNAIFEGEEPEIDWDKLPEDTVLLNVYDVGDCDLFKNINKVSTASDSFLVGGVFHGGIEIYGNEWCYGFTELGSGVSAVVPRTHPQHAYRVTVPMGRTMRTPEEVDHIIVKLAMEWPGWEYSLIHHNCLDFCNALAAELCVGRIPGWVDRFGRTASTIDVTTKAVAAQTRATVETAKAYLGDAEKLVREVGGKAQALDPVNDIRRGSEQLASVVSEGIWSWGSGIKEVATSTWFGATEQPKALRAKTMPDLETAKADALAATAQFLANSDNSPVTSKGDFQRLPMQQAPPVASPQREKPAKTSSSEGYSVDFLIGDPVTAAEAPSQPVEKSQTLPPLDASDFLTGDDEANCSGRHSLPVLEQEDYVLVGADSSPVESPAVTSSATLATPAQPAEPVDLLA